MVADDEFCVPKTNFIEQNVLLPLGRHRSVVTSLFQSRNAERGTGSFHRVCIVLILCFFFARALIVERLVLRVVSVSSVVKLEPSAFVLHRNGRTLAAGFTCLWCTLGRDTGIGNRSAPDGEGWGGKGGIGRTTRLLRAAEAREGPDRTRTAAHRPAVVRLRRKTSAAALRRRRRRQSRPRRGIAFSRLLVVRASGLVCTSSSSAVRASFVESIFLN